MLLKTHIQHHALSPRPQERSHHPCSQAANLLRICVLSRSLGSLKSPSHRVRWPSASPDHQMASFHQRAPSRARPASCRPDPTRNHSCSPKSSTPFPRARVSLSYLYHQLEASPHRPQARVSLCVVLSHPEAGSSLYSPRAVSWDQLTGPSLCPAQAQWPS